MKLLIYIESPYQLVNAIKYVNQLGYENAKYIVRDNGNDEQAKQIQTITVRNKVKIFSTIYIPKVGLIKKIGKVIALLPYFYKQAKSSNQIVIGDARSPYSKIILFFSGFFKSTVVFVDDGLYLISHIEKLVHEKCIIFSSLPIEAALKNNKKVFHIKPKTEEMCVFGEDSTIFIGMKLVEIGFLDLDYYLKNLEHVKNTCKSDSLIYYAHRDEAEEKLEYIRNIGYQVRRECLPLEEFFIKNGAPQGTYYCFYSTAIYNVSRMTAKCDFVSIRPDVSIWPAHVRGDIDSCYKLFELAGIKTINFE